MSVTFVDLSYGRSFASGFPHEHFTWLRRHAPVYCELRAFFNRLFPAGVEATRSTIAGGLLALIEYPNELARLRNDPALLKTGIEELLARLDRFELAGEPSWTPNNRLVGLKELPVRVTPRASRP
ncbi:MAG: hypothetical protein HY329_01315 [Chloroflexi bacterium]|nr:hypothetical protein [Chloroflexota bacterium]